ncbi:MAG TPA: hypothetical protein VJN68_12005 [Burkholderiaceae bacterium]|nr:hypothetical protein [Burkholderiaceae bacterium]
MQSTHGSLAAPASFPRQAADRKPWPLGAATGAVWRFLEAFGQRKAAAEILELAKSLEATRPEVAARMRRAATRSWD